MKGHLTTTDQNAESNDVLNAEQFDFRPKFSTTHQVKHVVNYIKRNRSVRKSVGMITLDVELSLAQRTVVQIG